MDRAPRFQVFNMGLVGSGSSCESFFALSSPEVLGLRVMSKLFRAGLGFLGAE